MRVVRAVLLAFSVGACSTTPPPACLAGKPAVETQLYFGLSTARGAVSTRQWQDFVDREIVPRFPQGFSVIDARGAWLSEEAKRTISENSKLLIRVHDGIAPDNAAINAVIESYKRSFVQESVMRVDQAVCVAF